MAVICVSNQKQNSLAVQMYADDHDSWFLTMQWQGGGGANRPISMAISDGFTNLFGSDILPARTPFPAPVSLPEHMTEPSLRPWRMGGLVDDLEYHLEGPGDRRLYNLSRMAEPSNQPIIIDLCRHEALLEVCRMWHRGSLETDSGHLRHARRANTIYADGHVEIADQD